MLARQINLSQDRSSVPEKAYRKHIMADVESRAKTPGTLLNEGVTELGLNVLPFASQWHREVSTSTTELDDQYAPLVKLLAAAQEDLNRLHDIVRPAGYDVVVCDNDGLVVYRHDLQGVDGQAEKVNASPTCVSAARIFDPEGEPIATLGVSSIDPDPSERSQLVIAAIVKASARAIEERAFRARYRSEWIVAGVRRATVRSAMVFAVDRNQCIVGADRDARAMFLRAGKKVGDGLSFWTLFERNSSLFPPMQTGDVLCSIRSLATSETWWALVTSPEPPRTRHNSREPASIHMRPRLDAVCPSREPARQARGGLAPRALRRVCEYIDEHFATNVDFDALATTAGMSRCHFARAFKQSVGTTPHAYLTRQRLAKAVEFLAGSDLCLAEIALACGFADQSHFTRVFSRTLRTTPGAWRRAQG
jgi:AraC-like DNA-binding protein